MTSLLEIVKKCLLPFFCRKFYLHRIFFNKKIFLFSVPFTSYILKSKFLPSPAFLRKGFLRDDLKDSSRQFCEKIFGQIFCQLKMAAAILVCSFKKYSIPFRVSILGTRKSIPSGYFGQIIEIKFWLRSNGTILLE